MSGFIRFLGSAFLFLWIVSLFFDNDILGFFPDEYKIYSENLVNNKWLLFTLGFVLSAVGTVTKVKKTIKKKKQNHSVSNLNDMKFSTDDSPEMNNNELKDNDFQDNYVQKDFITEQYDYKKNEFANKQQGQLKDIAMKVDWTPLRSGGANFKTSLLKQINSSRMEVHKSTGGFLFSALFAFIGIGILTVGTYFVIVENGLNFSILAPVLIGGVFAAVGIAMLIFPRPRVFDRRYGWFWVGNKSLAREQDFMSLKHSAQLSEIAAIQIVDEYISGSKGGSYTSWEINLIAKDGQRLNVMDHGNKHSISADARKLGEFLGVPVWENT